MSRFRVTIKAKVGLWLWLSSFHMTSTYSTNLTINYNCVYGVLGTQARGGRMVSTDESTELGDNFLILSISGEKIQQSVKARSTFPIKPV